MLRVGRKRVGTAGFSGPRGLYCPLANDSRMPGADRGNQP
jgi:hypothetical protein